MTKKKKSTTTTAKKKTTGKKTQAKKTTSPKQATSVKKRRVTTQAKKIVKKKEAVSEKEILSLQSQLLAASDRCNALAEEVVVGQAEHANALDELSQDKQLKERQLEKKIALYQEHIHKEQDARSRTESSVKSSEHMIALLNGELEILRDELTLVESRYQSALNTLVAMNARTQALEDAAAHRVILEKENADLKWYLGEQTAARQAAEALLEEAEISMHGLEKEVAHVHEELALVVHAKNDTEWYYGEAKSKVSLLESQLFESHTHSQNLLQQIADMQDSLTQANLLAAKWMGRCDELLAVSEGGDVSRAQLDDLMREMDIEDQLALAHGAMRRQKELEDELDQVKKERDSVLEINAYLQDELAKEKDKTAALQAAVK